MQEIDRIISPADSTRSITVGSVALYDSDESIVRTNEPSPFSRGGPGANYMIKPDIVDYGGNISKSMCVQGLGMKGLDINGSVVENIGTSYATPRAVQKFATILDELIEKDLLLAKCILIHSARMNMHELSGDEKCEKTFNGRYYGFGIPSLEAKDILQCSENEVTIVFKQRVSQGSHIEMFDFPYPKSLINDGKCYGEIYLTLAYNPSLDEDYGNEYCRTNVEASFGTYEYKNGKMRYNSKVPMEKLWDKNIEEPMIEHGSKWNPIKTYHRKIKDGIKAKDGWKLRVDMTNRNGVNTPFQDFVLIVTIKDCNGTDIYTEIVNEFKNKGYVVNNLQTKLQIRQRQ